VSGTAVEKREAAGELAPISPEEEALGAAVQGSIDRTKLKLPALKVCNGLSREAGEIPLGHLYNGLTVDDLGEAVDIIVCGIYYGRFYSPKGGDKSWSARGDVAPASWPEEYAGKRFTEIPDAEECWKDDSNAGVHPWGSGPPIQTTTNFICVLASEPKSPLRLSMKSSDTPTAEKIVSLIATGRMPWDFLYTIEVDSRPAPNGSSTYYGFEAKKAGKVDDEQRQGAIEIAGAYQKHAAANTVEELGEDDPDEAAARKAATKVKADKSDGIGV
jgi:hypothetical protein